MLEKRNKVKGKVLAVCISKDKHTPKKNIGEGILRINWGIVGDAHASPGKRQVSLLSKESIDKMKAKGLKVNFGDFAENITTEGIDLLKLKIGQRLKIGDKIELEVSQIGKECPKPCAIYYTVGDCIMPKEGIFVRILKGGKVETGDEIELI